ncbi:hypothetical protein PR048_030100 [Dryococelus australis]|uniref:Uncharacterized protein n=1 Tax=Dryococelus australis TaxID=614101 RepID=A0ABQ9G8S6_9NEOP|nr:hypothetical protein PR048_030100 [Dryococelus australis]
MLSSATSPLSLLTSHQGNPGPIPGRVTPDFRMWESCPDMLLAGRFPLGSPISPALSLRCCFMLSPITLIGSQDIDSYHHATMFGKDVVNCCVCYYYSYTVRTTSSCGSALLTFLGACTWTAGTAPPVATDISIGLAVYKLLQTYSAGIGKRATD